MRAAFLLMAVAVLVGGCDVVLDRALNRSSREITLPPPPPERLARPVFVVVERDRIIVEMDDGAQCLGPARGSFAANGWTGTFTECVYPYSYSVALAAGTPADAIVLNEVTGPPLPLDEGEIPFRPIAAVSITDTDGFTYRYESAEGF